MTLAADLRGWQKTGIYGILWPNIPLAVLTMHCREKTSRPESRQRRVAPKLVGLQIWQKKEDEMDGNGMKVDGNGMNYDEMDSFKKALLWQQVLLKVLGDPWYIFTSVNRAELRLRHDGKWERKRISSCSWPDDRVVCEEMGCCPLMFRTFNLKHT